MSNEPENYHAEQLLNTAQLLKALVDDSEEAERQLRNERLGTLVGSPNWYRAELRRVQAAAFRQALVAVWENYQRAEDAIWW